jgi:hypothetical protein
LNVTRTQLLLLPLFLHVGMTVFVGVKSLLARIDSVRGGQTRLRDIATTTQAWPDDVRKLGNNFDSQFDLPMLWYAVTALIVGMGMVDRVFVVLAWLFLAARLVHSYIHTGSNDVPLRMRVYLAGFSVIVIMWMWFGIRLYFIG